MEILPYQSLVGGDYGLRDVEDLLDATDRMGIIRKREANQLMWEAYRLVNIAIAQQVLLTGDVVLPVIHRLLWTSQEGTDERRDIVDVLRHHEHLGRNYLVMQLGREMRRHNSTIDYGGSSVLGRNLEEYATLYGCRELRNSSAYGTDMKGECDSLFPGGYEGLFASYWTVSSDGECGYGGN